MKDGFTFIHKTKGLVRCWVESGNVTTAVPAPISNAKWFFGTKEGGHQAGFDSSPDDTQADVQRRISEIINSGR